MTTVINADNGAISGVAGLKYSADSSGILVLQAASTTAITIDGNQSALAKLKKLVLTPDEIAAILG